MTMDVAERLSVDGLVYSLHGYPLEPYRKALPSPPRFPPWPTCSTGYRAAWVIHDDGAQRMLCLAELRSPEPDALALLSLPALLPLAATWFSGILRATRGERRYTGYEARTIYDDELFLEVDRGRVLREWPLDLRAVPEQTAEQWRHSVPSFFWKT